MMEVVTRAIVASKLKNYLHNDISLSDLVEWAENTMNEGEFDDKDYSLLRNIVAQLGLADVKAFSLSWEDINSYLGELGFSIQVKVVPQSH